MDVTILTELIDKIGFPIVMVGFFVWYINKKDKEKSAVDQIIRDRSNNERDMLIASIEKHRETNEEMMRTNRELAESNRLLVSEFSGKINNIENNIIEIKQRIVKY